MRPTTALGLIALIAGMIILASAIRGALSIIPSPQIDLGQIDWGDAIVGALLSIAGGALINLAISGRAAGRRRR